MLKKLLFTGALLLAVSAASAQPGVQLQNKQIKAVAVEKTATTKSAFAQAAQMTEVFKTQQATSQSQINIGRTASGMLVKQVLKKGDVTIDRHAAKAPSHARTYAFRESFESYDGSSSDWLPANWDRLLSDSALLDFNGNCSWHVQGAEAFGPTPSDGNYLAACGAALSFDFETFLLVTKPQDEWMYSPAFTVGEQQMIYFTASVTPLFLFNTNYVDFETLDFIKREISATVKVYIKEVGATSDWIEIGDIASPFIDMPFEELWDKHTDMEPIDFVLDLADYSGKSVQVAFRYVGEDGNPIGIDNIYVSTPQPQAAYARPQGALFFGVSQDYNVLTIEDKGLMLTPAYTPQLWKNQSNIDCKTFMWEYDEDEVLLWGGRTYDDLELCYGVDYNKEHTWLAVPTLTGSALGVPSHTYAWNGAAIQIGGKASYIFQDGAIEYGASNYDFGNDGITMLQAAANKPLYGYHAGINDTWSGIFGSEVMFHSIGNKFEKPASPYNLSGVTVLGSGKFGEDAQIKMSIIEFDGSNFGDTLATAVCKGSDIVETDLGTAFPYLALPFVLEEPLTIVNGIYVGVEGFETDCEMFGAFQSGITDKEETNGYFMMSKPDGSITMYPISALGTDAGACSGSFFINLMVDFPWFVAEHITPVLSTPAKAPALNDFDPDFYSQFGISDSHVVEFDGEGGYEAFRILASESAENWFTLLDPENPDMPEWLHVHAADNRLDTDAIDGRGMIEFMVDELPEGVTYREYKLCYAVLGAGCEFIIKQAGNSGINDVNVEKASVSKIIENGQVIIVKDGVRYNILGVKM